MPDFNDFFNGFKPSDFFGDEFLGMAYRSMLPNICFIKDNNLQGQREYIDLAGYVFKGMPEDIKQQYKDLLGTIIEKKQARVNSPDFWHKISGTNPISVDEKLGHELLGVFRIIQNTVEGLQKSRVSEGKNWFNITEEEIMSVMGIEQLEDILSAVYYPRTEVVQQHYDKVVSDKFNPFGVYPLISEQSKGVKR